MVEASHRGAAAARVGGGGWGRLPSPTVLVPVALTTLIARHLRFDAADPHWPDRDRLVADPAMAELAAAVGDLTGAGENFAITQEGPPGLAFAAALGLALAERSLAARFGRSLVDHRIWLLAGEAELYAGGALEAASLTGALGLARLAVLAELAPEAMAALGRFTAKGWTVRRLSAPEEVAAALSAVMRTRKPTLIAGPAGLRAPADAAVLARAGVRGAGARRGWLKRLQRHASRDAFKAAQTGGLPAGWVTAIREPGEPPATEPISTAETLRQAWGRLAAAVPELAGLAQEDAAGLPPNRALAWAAHTQAQAGALLGMALHGGVVPVGVLPWAAQDLAAPAMRAAAATHHRLLITLAEPDTRALVGQRAMWRAMPGLTVFRPADAAEALHCAALALRQTDRPSVILASAHATPRLAAGRMDCAHGGYLVTEPARRDLTLIASGPELHLALALREGLAAHGLHAAIVSLPCWEYFAALDPAQREAILGNAPRVALAAGGGFGWERWLGLDGIFIGLETAAWDDAMRARLLAQLLRRHQRSPAILETPDNVLESRAGLN
jgi:transketolase